MISSQQVVQGSFSYSARMHVHGEVPTMSSQCSATLVNKTSGTHYVGCIHCNASCLLNAALTGLQQHILWETQISLGSGSINRIQFHGVSFNGSTLDICSMIDFIHISCAIKLIRHLELLIATIAKVSWHRNRLLQRLLGLAALRQVVKRMSESPSP